MTEFIKFVMIVQFGETEGEKTRTLRRAPGLGEGRLRTADEGLLSQVDDCRKNNHSLIEGGYQ